MQLILNTETAVDIKAKMSLNEDNLEKCTSDVHSAVANGDVANGDIPNEDNGAGDSNKKIEQVKQNVVKTAGQELEQATPDDTSNNADIETSHVNDNKLNQAVDILNGKNDIKSNESVKETSNINENTSTELVNEETEHTYDKTEVIDANTIAGVSESVPIEDEQNGSISDSALTDFNHESSADIRMAEENEHSTTEKENTAVVYDNTQAESTDESTTVTSIADAKEKNTMETENVTNTEVALKDDDCDVNKITDATENIAIEKENNDVSLNTESTEIEVNSKNACANITIDQNEYGTNAYSANCNEDASPNTFVNHGEGETAKTNPEAELNFVNSTAEESEKVSIPAATTSSEEQKEEVDMMPEIDSTVNSKNDEEKKDSDQGDITGTNNVDVKKENGLNTETNSEKGETEQNIQVSIEKDKIKTDETDTSDENIDLIKLNINNESDDILECVRKELEEEERGMLDIEEKEAGNNDAKRKPDLMDVDESAVEAEVELQAKTSVLSISDVNKSSTNTLAVDEPISVQKDESVDLVPDSSDDVIFDVDDDKEQENESVKPKVSESSKIMEDENILASGSDDDKTISDSTTNPEQSDEIIDLDENVPKDTTEAKARQENIQKKTVEVSIISPVLKLSNTLDILSDEEDEPKETNAHSKCISIEDDDDVMLIDEDTCGNEMKTEPTKEKEKETQEELKPKSPVENMQLSDENVKIETKSTTEIEAAIPEKEVIASIQTPEISEKVKELSPKREPSPENENATPLLHEKFLKTCKKNLSEMTREELEEFCILKIVESVIDRSSLSEVKSKLKTLTQNIDEYSKKAKMLTKQNRDLQVVLKSIQEDQKKGVDSIVPLKITRSVGMQVLMTDKVVQRRKGIGLPGNAPVNKQPRNPVIQSPRPQKQQAPQIPVPRLVPANNPTLKSPSTQQPTNTGKITSPLPNGIKTVSPVQKAEKRTHNRIQSVTVDLTDDEPPAKVVNRAQTPAVPPVRLVPSQNLLAPPRPSAVNSPRKVYIPISGPQGQNVRAGQTIMLKTVPSQGPRQRVPPPHMVRMPQNMRLQRPQGLRHPAPLPDCMKQYQPPNWKALPPAPDLKLAKVENGIVISWKIEGYQEDSYEEIASYQLYAYQETASPPNTALWKKIGDVKALPLPMACTLTQFMAGYKYYFAVRAVDIRSRLGPFSLPGSILLLNKM